GWSIGLSLYSLMMVFMYDSVVDILGVEEILAAYPPEMMAFIGVTDLDLFMTPSGYLDAYFFGYMTVIIGIFVIGAAAGMLVGDEERGVLDLVLAHPISRTSLFISRMLALIAATVIVLLVCWLSWAVPSGQTQLNLTWLEFLLPFIPLLAQLLLFGALALLLSFLLPSARLAGMVTGFLLVGNYLLMGLYRLNDNLETAVKLTPLYYYQGGDAVAGLEWSWLAGILVVTLLFTAAAWFLFQQRDIRVGGEGSWQMPWHKRSRQPEPG
ncbi:MAG: ABC transporter permease subunit, partial [Chloroflexota bacterium]